MKLSYKYTIRVSLRNYISVTNLL